MSESGQRRYLKTKAEGYEMLPPDEIAMEMCIAKSYLNWKGHDDDALLTYSNLIKKFPDDFRGYLGKGLVF